MIILSTLSGIDQIINDFCVIKVKTWDRLLRTARAHVHTRFCGIKEQEV